MPSSDTRRRVLDAALACFLDAGYERTTIARIRARSGVSNGALFHHFPSKEAIVDALYVEAISSFQAGLWELVRRPPESAEAAIRGTIAHQLQWTEEHVDLARFVYMRGHPQRDSSAGVEIAALNRDLAAAFRDWMAPLIEQGELLDASMLMISAVVGGPAHAIARRWLAGQVAGSLTAFVDELADAAWAGLSGSAIGARPRSSARLQSGRISLELIAADGAVVAHGETTTELALDPGPADLHLRPIA